MNSSSAKIKNVVVSHEALTVELVDGRVISAPLTWLSDARAGHGKAAAQLETLAVPVLASTGLPWITISVWKVCCAGHGKPKASRAVSLPTPQANR